MCTPLLFRDGKGAAGLTKKTTTKGKMAVAYHIGKGVTSYKPLLDHHSKPQPGCKDGAGGWLVKVNDYYLGGHNGK